MARANLEHAIRSDGRSPTRLNSFAGIQVSAKSHLMRDLAIGCAFRALGKIEYISGTDFGKLGLRTVCRHCGRNARVCVWLTVRRVLDIEYNVASEGAECRMC